MLEINSYHQFSLFRTISDTDTQYPELISLNIIHVYVIRQRQTSKCTPRCGLPITIQTQGLSAAIQQRKLSGMNGEQETENKFRGQVRSVSQRGALKSLVWRGGQLRPPRTNETVTTRSRRDISWGGPPPRA